MAEIRFLADEHVPRALINGLKQRGVDVLSLPEANLLGATDQALLEHARDEGRVIFTQDTDFLRLHAAGRPHAGIAFAHQQTPRRRVMLGLLLIHRVLEQEEMVGRVEYI